MSRISQDFINDLGFLYEYVHVKDQDFLNEESEYYDEEESELVEDILSTISLSMIYEGFSANAVIGFLADSTEEDILEKYLSYNDNIIFESVVDENYIKEQLEILDYLIIEGWREKVVTAVGKFFAKRAPALSKGPGMLTQNAAYRLAMKGKPTLSTKARVGIERAIGPKGRKAVQAIKDFGGKAKEALTSPTAKKIALGAAGLGAAGLAGGIGGYMGAKLAGAGSGSKPTASPQPGKPTAAPAAPAAPKPPAAPSGSGGAGGAGTRTPGTPAKPKAPVSSKQTGDKGKDMETWAKANPQLAAKVKPGQSGYDVISRLRDKPSSYEKQDQTPTQGSPTAQIDTKAVEDALKAEQERQKKRMEQQNKTPVTAKESYEPYDVVLNYLLSEGHADTLDEANYIMLEMDENAICTIVEQYNDYLLAEEIQEWVNDLVEEGYDLSGYTWDDMVEYYVTEARVDAGKTDKEKREARADRNDTSGLDFFHTISRGKKKVKGRKTSYDSQGNMVRKYKTMQNDKKQAQRERDADEQRSRDRGGMSRGTWDKN